MKRERVIQKTDPRTIYSSQTFSSHQVYMNTSDKEDRPAERERERARGRKSV